MERFTERSKGGILKDPKSGQCIKKDRALNSGSRAHGPSYWKLFDRLGKKIATIAKSGEVFKSK